MSRVKLVLILCVLLSISALAGECGLNFPAKENFDSDPCTSGQARWMLGGQAGWSEMQALGGKSVFLRGPAQWDASTNLQTSISDIPQKGKIEFSFSTYVTEIGGNIAHLMNFGEIAQFPGTYPVLSIGLHGVTLKVYDGLCNGIWYTPGGYVIPLNILVRHRVVFDQDAKTYTYYVTVGSGKETVFATKRPLRGQIWGAKGFDALSSAPMQGACYYLDDISVNSYTGGELPNPEYNPDALIPGLPPIGYIQPDAQDAKVPQANGQIREEMIPDTCNLEERANLFIEFLNGVTCPKADYEPYNNPDFTLAPPRFRLNADEVLCGWPKYRESLPLMRIMTGSSVGLEIDKKWAQGITRGIGPDGLFYIPMRGRPWDTVCYPYIRPADGGAQYAYLPTSNGRLLGTLSIYYKMTGDEQWNKIAKGIVDRMNQLAIRDGKRAFFHKFGFVPNEPPLTEEEKVKAIAKLKNMSVSESEDNVVLWQTWIIVGLAQYYGVSHYEPARDLGMALIQTMRESGYLEKWESHFHCISLGIHGVVEMAVATKDKELLEYGRQRYEDAKTSKRLIATIPEIGYFVIGDPIRGGSPALEPCTVADMTAIAVKLAQGGLTQYWEDVDRYARNCLIESQVTRADQPAAYAKSTKAVAEPLAYNDLSDNFTRRMVGFWPTAIMPNELFNYPLMLTCCAGNCSRALYYAWESILDFDEKGCLNVNLLMNRTSPWADIDSFIPYLGKVDIKIKKQCSSVVIRVDEWVQRDKVVCKAGNTEIPFKWDADKIVLGAQKPETTISILFPISERQMKIHLPQNEYTITLRGNDVVDVSPRGTIHSIFQRDHYRFENPRYIKAQRFASERPILW